MSEIFIEIAGKIHGMIKFNPFESRVKANSRSNVVHVLFQGRQGRGGMGDLAATVQTALELAKRRPNLKIKVIFLDDYQLLCQLRPEFNPNKWMNSIGNVSFWNGERAPVKRLLGKADLNIVVHHQTRSGMYRDPDEPADPRAPLNIYFSEPDLEYQGSKELRWMDHLGRRTVLVGAGYGTKGTGLGYYLDEAARQESGRVSSLSPAERQNERQTLLQRNEVISGIEQIDERYQPGESLNLSISAQNHYEYLNAIVRDLIGWCDQGHNQDGFFDRKRLVELGTNLRDLWEHSTAEEFLRKMHTAAAYLHERWFGFMYDRVGTATQKELESIDHFAEWKQRFISDHTLEETLWGFAYFGMERCLDAYIVGIKNSLQAGVIPQKPVTIFTFAGGETGREVASFERGIFLEGRWGENANLIDLAAGRVHFPRGNDFSVTIINLGFCRDLASFFQLADLAGMVTGGMTLGMAMSTGRPFVYEGWEHMRNTRNRLGLMADRFLSPEDAAFFREAVEIEIHGHTHEVIKAASPDVFVPKAPAVFRAFSEALWANYNFHANFPPVIDQELNSRRTTTVQTRGNSAAGSDRNRS